MADTKFLIDLYTDWCIAYVANRLGERFQKQYFQSIANIVNMFNRYLHKTNSRQVMNAYARTPQGDVGQVNLSSLIDRVYLKGGCVADHYGKVPIKPSDIDCSISMMKYRRSDLESNLEKMAEEIQAELKWFYKLLPGLDDHEEFYDLIELHTGSAAVDVFNSYSGQLQLEEAPLNEAYTTDSRKIYSSLTPVRSDLLICRFSWQKRLMFPQQQLTLKINIVDLSVHLLDDLLHLVSLPLLKEERIVEQMIWTEHPYAMLNDQLLTYAGGVIRNDKKLIKRKNRVSQVLNQIESFNEAAIVVNAIRDEEVAKIIKPNLIEALRCTVASTEMYPYVILPALELMAGADVYGLLKELAKKKGVPPNSYLSPQQAVLSKAYEYYATEITELNIQSGIQNRLKENIGYIRRLMKLINSKVSGKRPRVDLLFGGDINANPSEDEVLNFIQNFDVLQYRSEVTADELDRLKKLSKLSRNTLGMLITDDEYNLYRRLHGSR